MQIEGASFESSEFSSHYINETDRSHHVHSMFALRFSNSFDEKFAVSLLVAAAVVALLMLYMTDSRSAVLHRVISGGYTYELMHAGDTVALARLQFLRSSGVQVAKQLYADDPQASKKLLHTLQTCVIGERGPALTQKLGSTIDKGRIIYVCLTAATGELQDEHNTLFVFLHELAHTITTSYNHTQEFEDNLQRLLSTASSLGLYDASKLPASHCGMQILAPRPRLLFRLW